MISKTDRQGGFVALITAIILSAILLIITTTLNQTSFFTRSNLLDSEYKERSAGLAEACIDIARLKLANDPRYSGSEPSIPIGTNSCEIRPIVGNTIETKAVYNSAVTNLRVVINPADISVVSWEEVSSFP